MMSNSTPQMLKSESFAYSQVGSNKERMSRISRLFKYHSNAVFASLAFFFFVLYITSNLDESNTQSSNLRTSISHKKKFNPNWGGASHPGYFHIESAQSDTHSFHIAAVTDLDQLSRVTDSSKPLFKSVLLPGRLTFSPTTKTYDIEWFTDKPRTLTSYHNEAGRGMELSELTLYQNRLLTFDDRTGAIFEVMSKDHGNDSYVVPRFIITEGDGDTDKGMKWEWATVKDNELYIGSMGKPYTNPDGSIANTNNLWIAVIDGSGSMRRLDWTEHYAFVQKALGASHPGYVIHEAILWSPYLKKWLFLPRRVSSEEYDENKDEYMGSNKLLLVDENFKDPTVVDIKMKEIDPLHGFSTFAFVPGTKDRHALAIRSVEEDCVGGEEGKCKQRSYAIVFDTLTGEVYMEEKQIGMEIKFEGVEFVDISIPEPFS